MYYYCGPGLFSSLSLTGALIQEIEVNGRHVAIAPETQKLCYYRIQLSDGKAGKFFAACTSGIWFD